MITSILLIHADFPVKQRVIVGRKRPMVSSGNEKKLRTQAGGVIEVHVCRMNPLLHSYLILPE